MLATPHFAFFQAKVFQAKVKGAQAHQCFQAE
jgi:hypothetical protein